MPSKEVQKIETALTTIMKQHKAVLSAYFFGSVAEGFDNQSSDVDVAVRADPAFSAEQAFELRLKLMDELESILGRPVDVVVLNSASLKMIHQALRPGRCVYASDPEEEILFGIQKRKEFFDFRYYIEDERKAMKAFFDA